MNKVISTIIGAFICLTSLNSAASDENIISSKDIQAIEDALSILATGMSMEVQIESAKAFCQVNDLSQAPGYSCSFVFADTAFAISSDDVEKIKNRLEMFATGQSVEIALSNTIAQCRNNTMAELQGFKCNLKVK